MCVLKAKEQALDEAFAADVTAFTKDEQKTAYLSAIQQRQKEYDEAKTEVDTLRHEMAAHKSGAIAARENLAISGDTLLSSSAALLYAGGDLSIIEKDSITNCGADITALGNVTLAAPRISNENEAFSAKRVWTGETVNPDLIRIDEAGHPEKGRHSMPVSSARWAAAMARTTTKLNTKSSSKKLAMIRSSRSPTRNVPQARSPSQTN